jgi:hypothetical protein
MDSSQWLQFVHKQRAHLSQRLDMLIPFFLSRDAKETSQHEQGIKYVLHHEDKQQMYCTNDLLRFLDLLRDITCHGLLVFSAVQA